MSSMELMRGFFALLFGGILAWGIYNRYDPEMRSEAAERPDRRYAPLVSPWLLPMFLLILLALLPSIADRRYALMMMGAMCLEIFLQMSLYFILLIALTPLLRRWISARACAALWLLPNFLYITQQSFMRREQPRWILHLEGGWLHWAVILWAAGVAAVLVWKITEHIVFRTRLRRASRPEEDPAILEEWEHLQKSAGLKKAKLHLYRTGALTTPLSVGLFRRTTFVTLPEKCYAPEELQLILRHELVHILRMDGQTKLFLTFCTAMCWFNPLMWLAISRASEDLELSCDELVLEYADEAEKHRYADLILRSAGDPKGFTSCLSATANSLRYRLKQIISPGRRRVGGITVGVVFFLLLISGGQLSFAYEGGTVQDMAFDGTEAAAYSFTNVNRGVCKDYRGYSAKNYSCSDNTALLNHIFSLPAVRVSGNFDFPSEGEFIDVLLRDPEVTAYVSVTDKYLKVNWIWNDRIGTEIFLLEQAPDWDYLDSFLTEIVDDPIPEPPDLLVSFKTGNDPEWEPLWSRGAILENTLNGEPSEWYSQWEASSCVIEGITVTEAEMSFSDGLLPAEMIVTARNWERTDTKVLSLQENEDRWLLELLPYSAHYTVEAQFLIATELGEQLYRMQYEFDVILPDAA